jgi:hypothetical protein
MAQNTPQLLVYKGDCERNRDCLKNDLKEMIINEREERKEGERDLKSEISTGINAVQEDIASMKNAVWGLAGSIIVAILIVIIEYMIGK